MAPFWQAAQSGQLSLPRCNDCGRLDWYPKGECRRCGGARIAWTALSGKATLFSWALVRRALDPRLAAIAPYISAIVTLEEDADSRFVTRLVDCSEALLRPGLPVAVRFLDLGYPSLQTGVTAPLFSPAEPGR
ncbi:hypothetical protein JI59_12770 [Novosphingobium pentaromativorans US6-1]|nr:hypothetical protein JI59_12770 [Novosphingobium pentaromativorans US6-1]